jgi:NADPH:quinone reductase-like Zn-dependent oxidoreductase
MKAEYAIATADAIAPKPKSLSYVEAASPIISTA